MEIEVGQVWGYRKNEYSQYSRYIKIMEECGDVWGTFDCEQCDLKSGYKRRVQVVPSDLLDNDRWGILDAEKICGMLEAYIANVKLYKECGDLCDNAQYACAKEREMRVRRKGSYRTCKKAERDRAEAY